MSTSTVLTDVNPEWNVIIPAALDQALLISSLIFGLFFITSFQIKFRDKTSIARFGYRTPSLLETLTLISLVCATVVFRAAYGSALGEAPAEMPFYLGTPIFRAHADLFPGLLLLCAEASWRANDYRKYAFWIGALALFNLGLALVTTSKAGLIFFAVQLIMLMYLTEQNIFARPWRLAVLVIAALAAFIVAAQLRSQALLGTDALILVSIKEGRIFETVLEVAGLVMNRLPGAEGLALYCRQVCSGLPSFTNPVFDGTAGILFTQQVVGVTGDFDFRSPGVIGGAIIIAGVWGGLFSSWPSCAVFFLLCAVPTLWAIVQRQKRSSALACSASFLRVFGLGKT